MLLLGLRAAHHQWRWAIVTCGVAWWLLSAAAAAGLELRRAASGGGASPSCEVAPPCWVSKQGLCSVRSSFSMSFSSSQRWQEVIGLLSGGCWFA
jgi:hypothetical protein